MELLIKQITYQNFKGLRNYVFKPEGRSVNVFANNGCFKTTLYDGFLWLLFSRDSQGKTNFEVKTLNPDGTPIHGLEHSVEAVLNFGGRDITLKKVFHELWQKKRGSTNKVMTGHKVEYYIDGIPAKEKDYKAKVNEIIDEDIFKLLTSPVYFSETLHWQKRREILLQVCGNLTDQDVIASDPALARLPEILNGRKIEDHRKVIAARRSEINKELERIPVRISEVQNNLPDISDIVPEALPEDIARLRAERQDKQAELAGLENGGGIAEKKRQIREIEAELLKIRNYHWELLHEKKLEAYKELNETESRVSSLQLQIDTSTRTLEKNKKDLAYLETRLAALRQEWYTVNDQQFEFEQSSTCPTCGQPMPEEKLAEAREKALAEFNLSKAKKLEEINRTGKAVREEYQRVNVEIAALEKQIEETKERLAREEEETTRLLAEVERLQAEAGRYEDDPAYRQKLAEKAALEEEIARLQAGNMENASHAREEIAEIDKAISALEEAAAKVKIYHQGQARIEELKQQERELAAEYERLEQELYLCEQFVRRKVELLESRINSKFKLAKFRLFETQINGGLQEVCEVTYNGVPYSNLNHGARINVGIDIINTLAEHYGFAPPVFIDNAEAITQLLPTRGQMIRLVVSERDKSLRVEVAQDEKILKEVI